jgi:uncharacterized protein YndB with AHSA1/START domain
MTRSKTHTLDPRLDLVLERVVDVPPSLVWMAWTQPKHVTKWFTPAPWKTISCEIDLRPGGRFHTVMQSPEGENFPNDGCFLEVVENERLVWTDALAPGYRPITLQPEQLTMTCILTLEPHGKGTKYTAVAMHKDEADVKRHEDMGFHSGWGKALDQLVEYVKGL